MPSSKTRCSSWGGSTKTNIRDRSEMSSTKVDTSSPPRRESWLEFIKRSMRLSSPRKEKEEAYPKLSNTDYSLADTPSGLLLVRTCIRPVWFYHNSAIPASNTFRSLCSPKPRQDSGATPRRWVKQAAASWADSGWRTFCTLRSSLRRSRQTGFGRATTHSRRSIGDSWIRQEVEQAQNAGLRRGRYGDTSDCALRMKERPTRCVEP